MDSGESEIQLPSSLKSVVWQNLGFPTEEGNRTTDKKMTVFTVISTPQTTTLQWKTSAAGIDCEAAFQSSIYFDVSFCIVVRLRNASDNVQL